MDGVLAGFAMQVRTLDVKYGRNASGTVFRHLSRIRGIIAQDANAQRQAELLKVRSDF